MPEQIEPPPGPLTLAEFYAWAELQPRGRFELADGRVVAMAPERVIHVEAKQKAWLALHTAVTAAALPCQAFMDGVAVEVGPATAYEPDAAVNCGAIADRTGFALPRPVIVLEVTSPSTTRIDMATKLADYMGVASIRHYLIVHLARRVLIHHRKAGDGGISTAILGAGPVLLDPPGITIQVEDLFPPA